MSGYIDYLMKKKKKKVILNKGYLLVLHLGPFTNCKQYHKYSQSCPKIHIPV